MDPLEMKYSADIRSPAWTRVSPGGAWVILNLMARALRQPLVDPGQHNKYNVFVGLMPQDFPVLFIKLDVYKRVCI